MKRLSLLAQTAVLVAGAWAAAAGLTEAEKIERLLEVVERSEVIFIRNGQEHGPKEAAEHLRSKWQAAGQRIGTAREFVEKLGSSSSLTGEPYRIRQGDGRERLLGEWLLEELRRIEEGPSSGPAPAATAEPAAAPAGPESGPESVLGLIRDSELEFLRVEGDEIEVRSGRQMAGHVRMKHVLAGSPEVGAEDSSAASARGPACTAPTTLCGSRTGARQGSRTG
jgi:hypothetical protein